MTQLSTLANELYQFLLEHENGASNEEIQEEFAAPFERAVGAINELLEAHKVQMFTRGGKNFVCKAILGDLPFKLEGIQPLGHLVYQAIQLSGNHGIWTRDIKEKCKITQNELNKQLKDLERARLVKTIRSVVSKSKKLYVLFDVVPAKSVTGGPWYSDQEFDHEFVSELSNLIVHVVSASGFGNMDLGGIVQSVADSQAFTVELAVEDVQTIVDTLVYDGRLEEINSSVLQLSGYAVGKKVYKVSKMTDTPDHLTAAPCGVCPVRNQCCEGGLISPATCVYMDQWLHEEVSADSSALCGGGGGGENSW